MLLTFLFISVAVQRNQSIVKDSANTY